MFDHVGVVFSDLKKGGDLYRPLPATIGVRLMEDHTQPDGTGWLVFSTGAKESPFFVVTAVDDFHVAGLNIGARNNGDPGVRRGRYYCAYLIDFDGNNIEAGVYE